MAVAERLQDLPRNLSGPETEQGATVALPAPGEVVSLPVVPGQTIRLGFDAGAAQVMIFGDDLVLDLGEGRILRLEDFVDAARAALPASLELADGRLLPGDALLQALAEAAGAAPISTAAGQAGGEEAAAGGGTVYGEDFGATLAAGGGLQAQGALTAGATPAALAGTPPDLGDSLPAGETAAAAIGGAAAGFSLPGTAGDAGDAGAGGAGDAGAGGAGDAGAGGAGDAGAGGAGDAGAGGAGDAVGIDWAVRPDVDAPVGYTVGTADMTGTEGDDSGGSALRGGGGDETIDGLAGDDAIWGKDGNDTLIGGDGADTLHGGKGADTLYGGAGDDTLHGDQDNDMLYGGSGDDTLQGGNGDDTLDGGSGADTLSGNGGADIFILGAPLDGIDTVTDFNVGQGDVLDLSQVIEDAGLGGVAIDAGNLGDYVQFTEAGGDTTLSVSVGGDTETVAILQGVTGLDVGALFASDQLLLESA